MTTSKSFRDVAEAEFDKDQTKESESTITSSDTQESTPEVKHEPAVQPDQDKTKPEATEDEGIKPFADKPPLQGKTPEQLEEIYQNWVKKYTQTRQKETAEQKKYQKEMDQMRKQLESYGTQNVPSAPMSPSVQKAEADAQEQVKLGNMTLDEYTAYVRQAVANDVLSEVSQMQRAQAEESIQQGFVNDFLSADDRLDQNSPNFSPRFTKFVTLEMADQLDAYMAENGTSQGFPAKELAQKIIAEYDNEANEMMRTRVQSSAQQARSKAASTAKTSPSGTSATTKSTTGRSFRQILEEQEAE